MCTRDIQRSDIILSFLNEMEEFVFMLCSDTCRWMAPQIFSAVGAASAVTSQPKTEEERITGLMALLSCPTYSIHSDDAKRGEIQKARDSLPTPAFPKSKDVFHLGFHDEASFGAASYLIRRPGGNIMFDVPRWNPSLASRIEKLGGVRYIILSHKDDVAAHQKYASRFGATRIIHSLEANSRQGTEKAEWKLEGEGPWMICDDVEIIHTPGHTEGHIVALYHPENVLFTGDHLGYSGRIQNLSIFRRYNRHSIGVQIESIIKLIDLDFNWILPGHGRRWHFDSGIERKGQLEDLVAREKTSLRS